MRNIMLSLMTAMAMTACTGQKAEKAEATQDNFNYVVDQFADLQILRYQVPGFESLSLKQKQLLYLCRKPPRWAGIFCSTRTAVITCRSVVRWKLFILAKGRSYRSAVCCFGDVSETGLVCQRHPSPLCRR